MIVIRNIVTITIAFVLIIVSIIALSMGPQIQMRWVLELEIKGWPRGLL